MSPIFGLIEKMTTQYNDLKAEVILYYVLSYIRHQRKQRRSLLLSFGVNKPYPKTFVFIEQRALGPIGEYIFVSF